MRLCIAEKKDVARKIAAVIGATADRGDWFEGNGYYVAWCQGHLLELCVDEAQGRWTRENLPIIPERFRLAPLSSGRDRDGKPVRNAGAAARIRVISDLLKRSDSVICGTDAAREGQLIFDNLKRYLDIRKPIQRLWVSSLTQKGISKGFASLTDNREYDNLATAARLRAEADWLVGINATRAFTLAAGQESGLVLSVGRVQTPTLCMVCRRYLENRDFVSEPFWVIKGDSKKNGIEFSWKGETKFFDKDEAETALRKVSLEEYIRVASVETNRKNEEPPLLLDLANLQKLANTKYDMTAHETLAAAQSLYEKGFLSYPRTDSRYIPDDVFDEVPSLLETLKDDPSYGQIAKGLLGRTLNSRSVNAAKVTDHHAIIITELTPSGLQGPEEKIYVLVLTRFLQAFSSAAVVDVTEVLFESAGMSFVLKSRYDVSPGWKSVCKDGDFSDAHVDEVDETEITMQPLPLMKPGDIIPILSVGINEDVTKPKPLLTEATLLSAMESAGKGLGGPGGKTVGIGTPATRDSVIEDLIKRNYIMREKKKLVPTVLGLKVFERIWEKDVANVEMTARWEKNLQDISDGNCSPSSFMDEIKEYTKKITGELLETTISEDMQEIQNNAPRCPRCGKPMRITDKVVSCPDREGCNWFMWRTFFGKTLTENQIKKLLSDGTAGKLKGLKRKDGSSFEAEVLLDIQTGKLHLPERETPPPAFANLPDNIYKCPKCGARLEDDGRKLSCKCGFSIWKTCWGHLLTDDDLSCLLSGRQTERITDFVSPKTGKRFEAALVIDRSSWSVRPVFDEPVQTAESRQSQYRCPNCGKPLMEDEGRLKCSCGFTLWKSKLGYTFCEEDIKDLLAGRPTAYVEGLTSKSGNTFTARFVADKKTGKVDIEFKKLFKFE